jgi:hypothetical protein
MSGPAIDSTGLEVGVAVWRPFYRLISSLIGAFRSPYFSNASMAQRLEHSIRSRGCQEP